MTDLRTDDHHVVSISNSQVYLVAVEYGGERRNADDALQLVRDDLPNSDSEEVYYEGLLSTAVRESSRDGLTLLRE